MSTEAKPAVVTRLVITLPLPSAKLSPNARVHWRSKAAATKAARQFAMMAALEALERAAASIWTDPPQWRAATEQATFHVRDKRRRDKDNLAASLKAYRDGITDAGILADDSGLTQLPVVVTVDGPPRVVIVLEQVLTEADRQKELFAK